MLLNNITVTSVLLVCFLWKNPQVPSQHLGYEKQMCTELFFSLIQCRPGERTHFTIIVAEGAGSASEVADRIKFETGKMRPELDDAIISQVENVLRG